MIDYGLLVSMIIAFGIPALVASWWTTTGREEPVAFLGLVVARHSPVSSSAGSSPWRGPSAPTRQFLGGTGCGHREPSRVPQLRRRRSMAAVASLILASKASSPSLAASWTQ